MILRLLSLTATIIVSSPGKRSLASALAFRPTPPPRFDVFSERLVGSWNTDDDGNDGEQIIVEEVMRSCGGAVQGLREPIPDDDPIYLNRANDGFVFFDNGCYTYGPLKRNDENGDDDDYLHSLMVGNSKSRVVIFGKEDKSSLMFQWKKSGALFDEIPPVVKTELAPHALKVDFAESIMCSKASPMQPWMLQRAKWQKEIFKEETPEATEPTSLNDSNIRCWSLTQPASDFYEWLSSSSSAADSKEEGTVVQAGTLCEATGEVNLIARHYDTSNDLKQVLFAEGICQS